MAGSAKKVVDHWAKSAFKPSHKGRLHRALGVPESEKIPADKMRAALAGKHGSKVKKMAEAAHNINK
jgi:hypothetical protein